MDRSMIKTQPISFEDLDCIKDCHLGYAIYCATRGAYRLEAEFIKTELENIMKYVIEYATNKQTT